MSKRSQRTISEWLQLGAASSLGIVAIAIGVVDVFGMSRVFANKIPPLTLSVVGVVTVGLVLDRATELRRLRDDVNRFAEGLGDIEVNAVETRVALAQMESFFGAISDGGKFALLRLSWVARSIGDISSKKEIRLGREHIYLVWLDCLRMSQVFHAFNYVTADEVWKEGWFADRSLSAQAAQVVDECDIRRVFVVDSTDESEALMPAMLRQVEAGIKVRWALRSDVERLPGVAEHLRVLGTWDLIALEANMFMRVFLDDARSMLSCAVTEDANLAKRVEAVFDQAFAIGQEPSTSATSPDLQGNI